MRILHVTNYSYKNNYDIVFSAIDWYAKNLIESLQAQGVSDNTVLTQFINQSETYIEKNVKVHRILPYNWKFLIKAVHFIQNNKFDIIHIQHEKSAFGGIAANVSIILLLAYCRVFNIKTITTIHGVVSYKNLLKVEMNKNTGFNLPLFIWKVGTYFLIKPLIIFSNKLIVHAEPQRKILVDDYKAKNKVVIIPIGIKKALITKSKLQARNSIGVKSKNIVILIMGFVNEYKGLDLLIDGLSILKKAKFGFTIIFGCGPSMNRKDDVEYMKNTYKRIKTKSEVVLQHNSKWVGFIPEKEIQDYYLASDVVIFPYLNNYASSGPMSIAIQYQRPYLVSDVFKHMSIDPSLVFQRDPENLAKVLKNFVKNKDKFSKQFRKLEKNYRWSVLAKIDYKDIYESV